MPSKQRIQIYLTDPIARLLEHLKPTDCPTGRLATVIERYEYVLSQRPSIDAVETDILHHALFGRFVDTALLDTLQDAVMDVDAGTPKARAILSLKLSRLTPGERVALVESLEV